MERNGRMKVLKKDRDGGDELLLLLKERQRGLEQER